MDAEKNNLALRLFDFSSSSIFGSYHAGRSLPLIFASLNSSSIKNLIPPLTCQSNPFNVLEEPPECPSLKKEINSFSEPSLAESFPVLKLYR